MPKWVPITLCFTFMSEADPTILPQPWGHQVNVGSFLRDVVQLMCCIDTGPSLRHIWRRERSDRDHDEQLLRFQRIAYSHLKGEVPRLLIAIAATLRTKLDDESWVANSETVGWMSQGDSLIPECGEPLNIRAACNRIIHAKAVHPQPVTEQDGTETIGALITLSGNRSGKAWVAEINLREFCIAVANTDFYPHGTGSCRH
jgi:hypothetical protein